MMLDAGETDDCLGTNLTLRGDAAGAIDCYCYGGHTL
jgi:hypothetical protein